MTMTGSALRVSASVKNRPRFSGIRKASKYPGEIHDGAVSRLHPESAEYCL